MQCDFMLHNLRIVEATHETGMIHGLYPNHKFDLFLAMGLVTLRDVNNMAWPGPSLNFFYENIGHTHRAWGLVLAYSLVRPIALITVG